VQTNLDEMMETARSEVDSAPDLDSLDRVRVRYLGKKGVLTQILKGLGNLSPDERRDIGQRANVLKRDIGDLLDTRKSSLKLASIEEDLAQSIDLSLPGDTIPQGSLHPVSQVIEQIGSYFSGMGFELTDGPELETDYYNFEALNIPPDHPARDMQDSFYLNENWLLRTQTSNMQIRVMEHRKPPLRILSPGKVFRVDNDATHSPMFHQIEGLLVDKNVTFANLKYVVTGFVRSIFGQSRQLRFRPSFFPFTEPSAEVDMSRGDGWMEIMGCGMIHPNVLRAVNIDPEIYTGFAFGVGVDRVAMLKYGIPNIRTLFENDVRFLRQFRTAS